MNKFVKVLFLLITLAIPVLIFVFLRVMGNNKFDIPIYYQENMDMEFYNCNLPQIPYHVPDSLLEGQAASLVYFFDRKSSDLNQVINHYLRLKDSFRKDQLPTFIVYTDTLIKSNHLSEIRNVKDRFIDVLNCGFISDTTDQYILVDKKRRIRGYYGSGLNEQDRLIVEIKILNENGDNK